MDTEHFDLDDREIVRAVQQGDTERFEGLVRKYQPRAYRIAHYYLHDQEEARDVVQESFLLAFKHIQRFRGDAKFSTWFVRIVINLSLNRLRKRRTPLFWKRWHYPRKESGSSVGETDQVVQRVADPLPNPEQQTLNRELGLRIRKAIDALPEKQKTVFILRHLDGLSIKDICQVTGMAEGTVKSYLSRSAVRIQEMVKRYYGEPEG